MTVRAVMPIALPSAKENQMTKPAALLTSLIASSLAFAANPVRILNTWTWPEPVTVLTTDQPVRLTLRPMSGSGAARTVDLGAPRERLAIDLPGRTILELETLRDQVSTRVEVELGARCVNADYRVIYQDAAEGKPAKLRLADLHLCNAKDAAEFGVFAADRRTLEIGEGKAGTHDGTATAGGQEDKKSAGGGLASPEPSAKAIGGAGAGGETKAGTRKDLQGTRQAVFTKEGTTLYIQ
jgi:hypothetical protein